MNDYQPTDEQAHALASEWFNPPYEGATDKERGYLADRVHELAALPAFQAIIRAAQAEAREDAASKLMAVVDLWRSDPDNWRFETDRDTRNWLIDVASDMGAGRDVVLTDEESADV